MKSLTKLALISSVLCLPLYAKSAKFSQYSEYQCSVNCEVVYGGYFSTTVNENILTKIKIQNKVLKKMSFHKKNEYLKALAQGQTKLGCQAYCATSWDAKKCTALTNSCRRMRRK